MPRVTQVLTPVILSLGLVVSAAANADTRVNAGLLTCSVEAGTGFIVGSSKDMSCSFEKTNGAVENYSGTIKKFGIDIGSTEQTTIVWAVLAPTEDVRSRALTGDYGGLSAEASAGYGAGANAMIGGSDSSIILQPFSGQVQEGFNIAVGVGTMSLR